MNSKLYSILWFLCDGVLKRLHWSKWYKLKVGRHRIYLWSLWYRFLLFLVEFIYRYCAAFLAYSEYVSLSSRFVYSECNLLVLANKLQKCVNTGMLTFAPGFLPLSFSRSLWRCLSNILHFLTGADGAVFLSLRGSNKILE